MRTIARVSSNSAREPRELISTILSFLVYSELCRRVPGCDNGDNDADPYPPDDGLSVFDTK